MKKLLVIHPFLFAVFPIVFLFSHNMAETVISETLFPITLALVGTFLLMLVLRLIYRDWYKAGIVATFSIVLFYSYGHIYNLLEGWQLGSFVIRDRLLLISSILLLGCVYLVWRARNNLISVNKIFTVVASALIFVSIINIAVYRATASNADIIENQDWSSEKDYKKILSTAEITPDIYYIILDGYANSNTLREVYGFENKTFIGSLIEKGFYVSSESRSNYATTFLSLSSTLNMKYINYLEDVVGTESKDREIPYQLIEKNKVMQFLKLKGYQFYHFNSGWGATQRNRYADFNIQCDERGDGGSEFMMVLIRTTMLRLAENYLVEEGAKSRVLCTFDKLAQIPLREGPKFVFAHINSPHPPYLFGANGESVPEAELEMQGSVWEQRELYLSQLIFVSKKTEILIEQILTRSENPPIIILQSDHGTASTFYGADGHSWESPTDKNLLERFGILNAIYLPGGGSELLYDSITPVNTFRLLFDTYFNMNLGLLEDRSYYSTYDLPYQFIEVTDIVVGDQVQLPY